LGCEQPTPPANLSRLGRTIAAMARRADPERIHQARRAAVRNGLTDYGMPLEEAERWCDAWELEAAGRGLPKDAAYWEAGEAWMSEQRAKRRASGPDR
jgi:hypothetical protein